MPEQAIWTYRNSKMKLLHKHALLRSLEDVTEAAETHKSLIYSILPLCLDEDKEVRFSSWLAVRAALKRYEPHQIFAIDSIMRNLNVQIASARDIARFAPPVEVCGLLSMNRNGYVRQAAVEALAKCSTGQELPYLLLRVTDWVEPVHDLATMSIERRMSSPSYLPHFVTNIALLPRIWQSTRYRLDRLRTALEIELSTSAQPELEKSFTKESEPTALYIFDTLAKHASDPSVIIKVGLEHPAAVIRLRAASEALNVLPPEHLERLVQLCLQDGSPQMRKVALRTIADNKMEGLNNYLFQSLFDRHGGVRLLARFLLKGLDFSTIYLNALSDSEYSKESILRALAETNTSLDRAVLDLFLNSERPRIRAAAYGLLFSTKSDAPSEDVLRALADPSSRCAKEVHKYLESHVFQVPMEQLLSLLGDKTTGRSKRVIVFAIAKLAKWDRLHHLLSFYVRLQTDEIMRSTLEEALQDWIGAYNRAFGNPSESQLTGCRDEMDRCRPNMRTDLAKSIDFFLK